MSGSSSSTRFLTVNGGNLFAIASQQLGDATQWYRFAQFTIAAFQPAPVTVSALLAQWDPWLSGAVTLTVPQPLPFGGGNDGILGL